MGKKGQEGMGEGLKELKEQEEQRNMFEMLKIVVAEVGWAETGW
ncbi:MAG: hypothetical protein QXL51_07865 [Candidatus Aenigmatarchaeota archaeon]